MKCTAPNAPQIFNPTMFKALVIIASVLSGKKLTVQVLHESYKMRSLDLFPSV